MDVENGVEIKLNDFANMDVAMEHLSDEKSLNSTESNDLSIASQDLEQLENSQKQTQTASLKDKQLKLENELQWDESNPVSDETTLHTNTLGSMPSEASLDSLSHSSSLEDFAQLEDEKMSDASTELSSEPESDSAEHSDPEDEQEVAEPFEELQVIPTELANAPLDELKQQASTLLETSFPITRIKRIMKADASLLYTTDASVRLIGLATEQFLQALIQSSLQFTHKSKRKTVMKSDIVHAIDHIPQFAFLNGKLTPPFPLFFRFKRNNSIMSYRLNKYIYLFKNNGL